MAVWLQCLLVNVASHSLTVGSSSKCKSPVEILLSVAVASVCVIASLRLNINEIAGGFPLGAYRKAPKESRTVTR